MAYVHLVFFFLNVLLLPCFFCWNYISARRAGIRPNAHSSWIRPGRPNFFSVTYVLVPPPWSPPFFFSHYCDIFSSSMESTKRTSTKVVQACEPLVVCVCQKHHNNIHERLFKEQEYTSFTLRNQTVLNPIPSVPFADTETKIVTVFVCWGNNSWKRVNSSQILCKMVKGALSFQERSNVPNR